VSKWIKAAHIQVGVMNFEFVIQYRSTGGNIDVGEEAGGTIFCAMLALDVGKHLHGPKHSPTGRKLSPSHYGD